MDNAIPIFAVYSGWNLSFLKDRIVGLWKIDVPNVCSQFRSRDQYPEAMMKILGGDLSMLGEIMDPQDIPDVPKYRVGSVDKYMNIKTTITIDEVPRELLEHPIWRITINGISNFVLNTLINGVDGVKRKKIGDLCVVQGSSGGKKHPFIEFIRLSGKAARDWDLIEEPIDELDEILIEPVKEILYIRGISKE